MRNWRLFGSGRFGMRIEAAAIRFRGLVFTGLRHHECFAKALESLGERPIGCEQGFVTDRGVFLDRKEALVVAQEAGQIRHKHPPLYKLMSEDMW